MESTDRKNYFNSRKDYKNLIKKKKIDYNKAVVDKLVSSIDDKQVFYFGKKT